MYIYTCVFVVRPAIPIHIHIYTSIFVATHFPSRCVVLFRTISISLCGAFSHHCVVLGIFPRKRFYYWHLLRYNLSRGFKGGRHSSYLSKHRKFSKVRPVSESAMSPGAKRRYRIVAQKKVPMHVYNSYIYIHTNMYIYILIHPCIHIHIYVHTYIYIHYICIYIYVCIYIYGTQI